MTNDQLRREVYASTKWKKLSAWVRKKQPICPDPLGIFKGRPMPVAEVHHIIPVIHAPHLAYAKVNLIALSEQAHDQIEHIYQKHDIAILAPKAVAYLKAEKIKDSREFLDIVLTSLLGFGPKKGIFDLNSCQKLTENKIFCTKMNAKRIFRCSGCNS